MLNDRPQWVLFDLDHVLCHYDRMAFARALATTTGRDPDLVHHAIWASGLDARSDCGELGPEAYLQAMSEQLECVVSPSDWLGARRQAMAPDAAVLALVGRVRQRCAVAVLTNNSPMVADHMDFLCPEIASHFGAAIHASGSLGAAKPQAEAFHRCVERLGVWPQDVLFIDDLPDNVLGAKAAGLRALHFVGADQLARDLDAAVMC